MADELKLSRGWNHLGEIAKTLGDLRGLRTVIHELIQNADDAPAVTRMRFTVTDELLEVWNDGEFERCSDLTAPECELLGGRGFRCDFHSFRDMGSGDKRNRAGTTGAFGMGFTAVYQLTDHPELVSNGEKWVIDETATEDARITRTAAPAGHEGTSFRLPWATSPSRFRKATHQDVVSNEAIVGFYDELVAAVPRAMPFLKHLEAIEIGCGSRGCVYEREPSSDGLIVKSSDGARWTWAILQGNCADSAEALKAQYPEQIEAARSTEVAVAFPLDADAAGGVLYASLPTEESSHLPLLINADFYPASDRKRIRFDDAPESEFNRTAIRAAARCIAADLAQLPDRVGDRAVVGVLVAALELSRRSGQEQIDSCFVEFWQEIVGELPGAMIVPVASGGYECATNVRLWREDAEVEAATVLAEIGISLVDAEFRDDWYRLRSHEVGLQELNVGDVVVRLRGAGLISRSDASQLSGGLATERGIASLWGALEVLLAQSRSTQESRKALQDCAVAPGSEGALWPLSQLLATDAETEEILGDAGAATHFLDAEKFADYPTLTGLVDVVDAGRFLELLESAEEAGTLRATLNSKLRGCPGSRGF